MPIVCVHGMPTCFPTAYFSYATSVCVEVFIASRIYILINIVIVVVDVCRNIVVVMDVILLVNLVAYFC